MFRSVALFLGDNSWNRSEQKLQEELAKLEFSVAGNKLLLNNKPLNEDIRTEKVGYWASKLGKISAVREFLKHEQQSIGQYKSLVAEGRDMGTVVFPQADFKFFLHATLEVRARRRWLQFKEAGQEYDLQEIKAEIRRRDLQDSTRQLAPLKAAGDAHIIDTSHLDKNQVLQQILGIITSESPDFFLQQ